MSAADRQAFEQTLQRVQELTAALAEVPDAPASAAARELVQVVLDLHAAGLGRLRELVEEADGGLNLLQRLAADDQVAGLLLLHGLHPDGLEARVRAALERLRPHLGVYGIRVEAVELVEDSVDLRVCAAGGGQGKKPAPEQLKQEIEEAIYQVAPDVGEVRIQGLAEVGSTFFVPISNLTLGRQHAKSAGNGR